MKKSKGFLSILLALVMVISALPLAGISAFAVDGESSTELIDPNIFAAQCITGIVKVEQNQEIVTQSNDIYNYYTSDDVFTPSQSFLQNCYADKNLMSNYNQWLLYSLAADPSSAMDTIMKDKDYYETLIITMFNNALKENVMLKYINNEVLHTSNSLLSNICKISGTATAAEAVETLDMTNPATAEIIDEAVKKTFMAGKVSKVSGVVSDVISYSSDILKFCDKLSVYNSMSNVDDVTMQWLRQMRSACTKDTATALMDALDNLIASNDGFAKSAMTQISEAGFVLTKWVAKESIDLGIKAMTLGNPVTMAVVAGFKAGKTLCNLFFATDDVCEQFHMMECVYKLQTVARATVKNTQNTFLENQNNENASLFIKSLDCYYQSVCDIDIDLMKDFLYNLYSGGILSGVINSIFGASDDLDYCISGLDGLKAARIDKYNLMNNCWIALIKINYPQTWNAYFAGFSQDNPNITDIGFVGPIKPIYMPDYCDLFVGDSIQLRASFTPENTLQRSYTITSDNPGVISVNGDILTAVSMGSAKITIRSNDNAGLFYTKEYVVGSAEDRIEAPGSRFTYTVSGGKACITGLVSGYEPTSLYIPSVINGYPVTSIDDRAFYGCTSLTSATIGDGVTSIGWSTFEGCTSLTSIVIPNSVTSIDYGAFSGCTSLTSIVIPDSVTRISGSAFMDCTSLTSATIGDGVTSIGWSTFEGCTSLKSITVDDKNPAYLSIDGVLFYKDKTELICYPAGKEDKSYTIPDSVTSIGRSAFFNCTSLTSIAIPDSVTSIGHSAFRGCTSLTSVVIPNSVTSIGSYAFENCTSLTSVVIPNSVTSIGSYAFENCTSLTSIVIPDSVTSIGGSAFWGCTSLSSVVIPDSVTSIGVYAFWGCTSLSSVIIGDSVTSIGDSAFGYCESLTSVTIPDSVTSIGDDAFCGCTSLSSVIIGDSVTSIGSWVFGGCTSLKSITVDDKNSTYLSLDGVLFNKNKNELICYPAGKEDKSYTIPDGVTTIEGFAFENCTSLKSIVIPNSVTSIEHGEFWGCTSLLSITIGDSVTSIGSWVFAGCTSLTSIVIPDSVTSIGETAFWGCTSLTSIAVGDSVTSIGDYAFYDCTLLTTIYGAKGSYVESYAKEHGYIFIALSDFADDSSKISITAPVDSVSKLAVNTKTVSNGFEYDISLTKDGLPVDIDGSVTVKIPVPESMQGKDCYVYFKNSSGEYINVTAALQNGCMVFNTDSLGKFVLSTKKITVVSGDLNGDGNVDAADAVLMQRYDSGLATLTAEQLSAADVTGDGTVDAADAVKIQRYDAGLISEI